MRTLDRHGQSSDHHRRVLTKQDILRHREQILSIARRYGATDLRIFGSVARGDATASSDLDILVRFEPGRSLLDQGGLLMDLRELLGVNVDVVSEGALSGRFGELVRAEAVPL
jgi:predicted nucleotidyltransferase